MPTLNIKALIFDVDGTLYRPVPDVEEELRTYWIRQLAEHKKLSIDEAEKLYMINKKLYKSSTLALEKLGLGDPFTIIKRAEKHQFPMIKKTLKPDRQLHKVIKALRGKYALYTLRNGTRVGTRTILKYLGFENKRQSFRKGFGPFDDILPTVELGLTKPNPIVFEKALKSIGLAASQVAIIGDRPEVDLFPAKRLGINTVWVSWGKTREDYKGIDAVVETVYDCMEFIQNGS